ncbi:MAG: hypothetical protein M3Y49_04320 [Actinomycetota bacterium]|nr:hypothetical protein [Actinomycetota bacterium]
MSRQSRWARQRVVTAAIAVSVLIAGCGSQIAPGGDSTSPPASQSVTIATPSASKPSVSTPKTPTTPLLTPTFDQATYDLIRALDVAAHARYVNTFGSLSFAPPHHGVILAMTDLANARALISSTRAGHPQWSRVAVTLVKVTYTEAQLQAAQNAVSPTYWKKYELVSVGSGAGDYVDVGSSDPSLKGPGGRVGRERLASILTRAVGVRVIVTYSLPAQAANG